MSEFKKIHLIENVLGRASSRVQVGIGDDAAVVELPRSPLLLCSDAMVEGVHFDLAYCLPAELGHKALASCLSDIAAMNGKPLHALFSLALPKAVSDEFISQFYLGAASLARVYGVDIVGGDLTASPNGIFVDVTLVGEVKNPLLRSGARAGDWVAVSGHPGLAAAGLQALKSRPREEIAPSLIKAHLTPRPRFDLLPLLQANCTSLIDISDGVSSELHHLAEKSKVGFELNALQFPLHLDAVAAVGSLDVALTLALSGGEDYELLATFDGDVPEGFTVIGRAVGAEQGLIITNLDGSRSTLELTGYNHFKPQT